MDHAELHSAAASGDEAAVRRALQSSAAHVQEEEHGRSALMLAAAGGHEAVVSLLLSSGMRPCRNQARCGRPARPKRLTGACGQPEACSAAERSLPDRSLRHLVFDTGAPWNAIDRRGQCAGNYALDAGHQRVVDLLVEHGVRSELVLGASERRAAGAEASNAEYLSRSVRYEGDNLLDTEP